MPVENTDQILTKGKRVTLEFVSNNSEYVRASQIAVIESRLNGNPDIEIVRANYWGDNSISFELEVKNDESLMTERKMIALIMSVSPVYFYLVHKPAIDKTIENLTEQMTWANAAGWALLIFIVYKYVLGD